MRSAPSKTCSARLASSPGPGRAGEARAAPQFRPRKETTCPLDLARHAVAPHLAEARTRGEQQKVLFAADAAARAYCAKGFQSGGTYGLLLFDAAQTLCISAQSQEEP